MGSNTAWTCIRREQHVVWTYDLFLQGWNTTCKTSIDRYFFFFVCISKHVAVVDLMYFEIFKQLIKSVLRDFLLLLLSGKWSFVDLANWDHCMSLTLKPSVSVHDMEWERSLKSYFDSVRSRKHLAIDGSSNEAAIFIPYNASQQSAMLNNSQRVSKWP